MWPHLYIDTLHIDNTVYTVYIYSADNSVLKIGFENRTGFVWESSVMQGDPSRVNGV